MIDTFLNSYSSFLIGKDVFEKIKDEFPNLMIDHLLTTSTLNSYSNADNDSFGIMFFAVKNNKVLLADDIANEFINFYKPFFDVFNATNSCSSMKFVHKKDIVYNDDFLLYKVEYYRPEYITNFKDEEIISSIPLALLTVGSEYSVVSELKSKHLILEDSNGTCLLMKTFHKGGFIEVSSRVSITNQCNVLLDFYLSESKKINSSFFDLASEIENRQTSYTYNDLLFPTKEEIIFAKYPGLKTKKSVINYDSFNLTSSYILLGLRKRLTHRAFSELLVSINDYGIDLTLDRNILCHNKSMNDYWYKLYTFLVLEKIKMMDVEKKLKYNGLSKNEITLPMIQNELKKELNGKTFVEGLNIALKDIYNFQENKNYLFKKGNDFVTFIAVYKMTIDCLNLEKKVGNGVEISACTIRGIYKRHDDLVIKNDKLTLIKYKNLIKKKYSDKKTKKNNFILNIIHDELKRVYKQNRNIKIKRFTNYLDLKQEGNLMSNCLLTRKDSIRMRLSDVYSLITPNEHYNVEISYHFEKRKIVILIVDFGKAKNKLLDEENLKDKEIFYNVLKSIEENVNKAYLKENR